MRQSRSYWLAAGLALASGCLPTCATPASRGAVAEVEPIYRYINVGAGQQIRLGERFAAHDLAARVDDSTYALHSGAVTDAVRIRVHVTPDDRVYALDFGYQPPETYAGLVERYTRSLGEPQGAEADAQHQSTTWMDPATTFTIHARSGAGEDALTSRLTDFQLGTR